jgi:hypothetical protein
MTMQTVALSSLEPGRGNPRKAMDRNGFASPNWPSWIVFDSEACLVPLRELPKFDRRVVMVAINALQDGASRQTERTQGRNREPAAQFPA